jgi:molybdate transport system substrate-binding protein
LFRKLVLFTLVLAACAPAQELKVAAAADLDVAMKKVAAAFQQQTGIQLKITYGSSGHFFAEIRNGAPFDVFLSADRSYPETLESFGKTDKSPSIYALGKLVLWVSYKVPVNPSAGSLEILTNGAISKVAIANPEHAPYGRAAVAAMDHYKVYDRVKPKLVLGENVSQAAQFAESGNAEAALIPWSLALSDSMKKTGRFVLLPQESYPPLYQAAVVLHSSQYKAQAHRFLDFLRSRAAQKMLLESGFEASGK